MAELRYTLNQQLEQRAGLAGAATSTQGLCSGKDNGQLAMEWARGEMKGAHPAVHTRYTGTGHPDTTKYEWLTHQHRDTAAAIVGHPPLLAYISIADGECQARERFEVIERMLQPCGNPPAKTDD